MDFELAIFMETLPSLLRGALITAQLAFVSALIGVVIGTLGGLARVSGRRWLGRLALVYVTLLRAVPLLMTIMFLYYGLPVLGVQLPSLAVAILALSITNGAYVTEIVRSGIQSIDRGQMRAARSLGMSYAMAMRRIILPQALRRVLPPLTNESITLLKNTALVSTIAISELLRAGIDAMTWKANTFSPFAGVVLIYLLLTLPLLALNGWLERKYRVT